MSSRRVPDLDDELRSRLSRRFGAGVAAWLDALPPVLSDLAERWDIEFDALIQRGSISVVVRCRTANGSRAVLKVSPERRRVVDEAAALARWTTVHVPAVIAFDDAVGALLIESIEPGTQLSESTVYPPLERLAALIRSIHRDGRADSSYESVAQRVSYLFEAGRRNYDRRPELVELVPWELYERGHELAARLAESASTRILLHGDLTPANVLDGGDQRGLVAIDPAPCLGDPAFDAVDLVLWRAGSVADISARAASLAPAIDSEPERLLSWCRAFAAMVALEIAEASPEAAERIGPLVALASAAPTPHLPD